MKIIKYNELTPELARAGCLVLDMPNEDYHAYEGISKSGLDLINKSPRHYLAGRKPQQKRYLELGTALHTAVLEPQRFKDEYMILKGITTRTASEYKQAEKQVGSELVLTETEAANITGCQDAVQEDIVYRDLIAACDLFEVSAFIEIQGVLVRCRYDTLNTKKHHSIDLKTTQSSHRDEFSKSVYNYRYHVQDALYSEVYKRITGHELTFGFLAIENEPPHNPMLYYLDDDAKMIGRLEAQRNISEYKHALESHEWSSYKDDYSPLSLPYWAVAQFEDQLEGEIV